MTIETANRLLELRKKHGLSQEELAEKLGVSRQAVSKWERSEASPDTDNLIALAKIYDLSLDELVFGERNTEPAAEENETPTPDPTEESPKGTSKVDIGPAGIFIESDEGDKVQINLRGIKITEGKHSNNDGGVKIDFSGLKFDSSKPPIFDNDDDDDDDDEDEDEDFPCSDKSIWHKFPYPIACVIAYLIFGCYEICGGWACSWIIFLTIPLYYSLVEAICKRRFCDFAFPVLTAFVYLYLGLYHGNWHPSWIVFLTVPIYYPIATAIDKKIRSITAKKDTNTQDL